MIRTALLLLVITSAAFAGSPAEYTIRWKNEEYPQVLYDGWWYSISTCKRAGRRLCPMCVYIENGLDWAWQEKRDRERKKKLKQVPAKVAPTPKPGIDLSRFKPKPKPKKIETNPVVPLVTLPAAEDIAIDHDAMIDALAALQLTSTDVFADIGCGDGRVLIWAVRCYRCRAIGIEIDPERAAEARANVAAAIATGKIDKGYITIVQGNAAYWDPRRYGVTAGMAYLFPETLGKLRETLQRVPRLSVPFHQVPGMTHALQYRDNYVYLGK